MHFLPSAEVFSIFPIVTPLGRVPNKKATKVSYLPPRPKDFLIFCVVLFIPHYWALSNNLFIATEGSECFILRHLYPLIIGRTLALNFLSKHHRAQGDEQECGRYNACLDQERSAKFR